MTSRPASVRGVLAARPGGVVAVLAVLVVLVGALRLMAGISPPEQRAAASQDDTTRPASTRGEPPTAAGGAGAALEEPHGLADLPGAGESPRLNVPAIGVDAPVVPVPLKEGGVLDPPESVTEVGWWDDSAAAGDDIGQTVLTGHTVHDGGGVMDDLDALRPGDDVRVTGPDGHTDYEVTEVVTWSKSELTENAVEAFGQDRHHGRLVLVTCEDWSGGDYDSNVVVFADPVEAA